MVLTTFSKIFTTSQKSIFACKITQKKCLDPIYIYTYQKFLEIVEQLQKKHQNINLY